MYGKQKNYSKDIEYVTKGISTSKEIGRKDLLKGAFEELSEVYAKTGDPVSEALDTSQIRCADCSWYGPARKLTRHFMY